MGFFIYMEQRRLFVKKIFRREAFYNAENWQVLSSLQKMNFFGILQEIFKNKYQIPKIYLVRNESNIHSGVVWKNGWASFEKRF